jgi:DNA polymerase-3 subunit chi
LTQLDTALWTFSPLDFVPHCFSDNSDLLVKASPILLGYPIASASGAALPSQVLLNLGHTNPEGFERFERLIELVGLDDEDRQAARYRWKHYAGRGYDITRHDLATSSAA